MPLLFEGLRRWHFRGKPRQLFFVGCCAQETFFSPISWPSKVERQQNVLALCLSKAGRGLIFILKFLTNASYKVQN